MLHVRREDILRKRKPVPAGRVLAEAVVEVPDRAQRGCFRLMDLWVTLLFKQESGVRDKILEVESIILKLVERCGELTMSFPID